MRFLALYFEGDKYVSPMKAFLNSYVFLNRHLTQNDERELRSVFESTIQLVHESIGAQAFRPTRALNAAAFDSIMVGLAKRIQAGRIRTPAAIKTSYDRLMGDRNFQVAIGSSTSDIDRVKTRMDLATAAFADVG